ncbi:hypothetical protein D3C80_2086350 [compost metagenome]
MSPKIISDIVKNGNPNVGLEPVALSDWKVAICFTGEQQWISKQWDHHNDTIHGPFESACSIVIICADQEGKVTDP